MNRIKLSPLASASSSQDTQNEQEILHSPKTKLPASIFAFDQSNVQAVPETSFFAPLDYEKNYEYPLIVWLHSDGQSSSQLESLMAELSMQNYVGVAPQAPIGNFQCGYFWEQDFDSIQSAQDLVADAIDQAQSKFSINRRRIFLAGSGGGGTMALRLAMQQPDLFAGVVSLNGPLPHGQSPLAQWNQCRTMPIFWSHFIDQEDDANEMCKQFRFLYSAGFLNVTAREYPTLAHLEKLAPRAINQWVMEQISSAIL